MRKLLGVGDAPSGPTPGAWGWAVEALSATWAPRTVLVVVFVLTRIGYAALGVTFDTATLGWSWQFVDPVLLEHDLLRSVWYLHAQPPLYNLFLGVVLNVFGSHHALAFHAVSLVAGLVMTLGLHGLVRAVGRSQLVAVAAALFVMANPGTLLYENWLYVEYLAAAGLVVVAACVWRFAISGSRAALTAGVSLAAVIVLSRSIFHLVWLAGVTLVFVLARKDRRRHALVAGAIALAVCTGVYAKNAVVVGRFAGSSCLGVNTFRVTTLVLNEDERRRLVEQGTLSKYASLSPFALPDAVPEEFASSRPRGVPVLDSPKTSTGVANFNHHEYPRLCREYERDSIAALEHRPGLAVAAVGQAGLIFLRPIGDFDVFSPTNDNRSHVAGIGRIWDAAVMLQAREPDVSPEGEDFERADIDDRLLEISWTLAFGYAVAIGGGGLLLVRRARAVGWADPHTALLAFCMVTVVYVLAVGNLLEVGENNRFHVLTDPLVIVTLALVAPSGRSLRGAAE